MTDISAGLDSRYSPEANETILLGPAERLPTSADEVEDLHRWAWEEWGSGVDPELVDRVTGAMGREYRRRHALQVAAWPETPRPPGPQDPDPLPLEALPPVLRKMVNTVTASVQVASDLAAGLVLAAVSAAVGGRVVVRVDEAWTREEAVLYVVPVAGPAERKSSVYRPLVAPLREWEAERERETAPRRRVALAIVEARERAVQQAQRDGSDDAVEAAVLRLQEAEGAVPVVPQLLAQDSTPEALVRQMEAQGGRVAVLSPEGGPLRILDGRYSDGVARLEELAQAYDGEEIRVGRVGRPGVRVRRPALTLGVMVQPSVLATIRNGRSLRGQGIYGRISWLLPRSLVGTRVDSSEAPALDRRAALRYREMLHALLDWSPAGVDDDGTPIPHEITLSTEAAAEKMAYHAEVEAELGPGGELAGMADWAGKVVGRAIRIAALLDLAARASEGRPLLDPVSGWAMEGAVRICRALTTHARAAYGAMELDSRAALLRDVLRRARELPVGGTLRDLYRSSQGLSAIESMEGLGSVVEDLCERGCLRLVDAPREGPGRPRSPMVETHPSLRPDRDRNDGTPPRPGSAGNTVNTVTVDAGEEEVPA